MPKRIIAILLALMLAVPAMALAEPEFPDEVYERYDSVETYWYSSQMGGPGGLFPVSKDERYGFINFAGEEVVPLIYDYTEGLSNGMGCVHKDGKIGFVNLSGEMVIPLEYDNSAYTINGDIFALLKGGKWGVVDITGTEHSLFIYDEIGSPSEGMVMVIQGDKMGFISTDGGADISVVYDAVYKSCGNCRQLVFTGGYAPVRLDGLWGFIRKNGTVTVPLIYDNAGDFGDGLAPVKKGDKWGYIDEAGSQKLPFVYDNAWNFSSGEAKVRLDGLLGYINKNGEKLRGFIFEDEADFSSRPDFLNGYILAKKDGKWGVVSSDYETVAVPFEYDEIEYDGTTTYAENLKVKLNDKYGFIDLENNTVFPIEISFFTIAGEGLQSYCRDGLWGYMDMYQNPAVEPAYDMAWPFKGGLAQVKTGEGWGFIDKAGRVIIEAKYNTVMDFSEGLAAAQNSGGKWGFIDRNGNTVVDFTLDGGGYFYGGVAKIKAGAPDYIQDSDFV